MKKVFLWFISSWVFLTSPLFTIATPSKPTYYYKDGDIIIGGLFPLHYEAERPDNYSLLARPEPVQCIRYNFLGFQWMQAMIFAIEKINEQKNLQLGYQIFDTCNTNSRAVNQAIFITQQNVSAVIGPTGSALSTVTSNIFSLYDVPQISHGSTSRILSEKNIYRTFFRTIPNDDEQTKAILDLLLLYNWKWVGAIAGDNDYGRPAIAKLKQMARANNICIEYTSYVSKSMPKGELLTIAEEVRDFNATVFVLFISTPDLEPLARQLSSLEVYNKVWIASEAWATSNRIREVDARLFEGTLGIAESGGPMPGFREFLENVSPSSQPQNPFIREFWERSFNCTCNSCPKNDGNTFHEASELLLSSNCSLAVNITSPMADTGAYLDWTGTKLEKSYNVYLAVHALAEALQNIKNCRNGSGLLENGICPDIAALQPWQLLAYLQRVNFSQPGYDVTFSFNEFGDPQAAFKIVNWQPQVRNSGAKEIDFVDVGYYSSMTSPTWNVSSEIIFWNGDQTQEPSSVCTSTCPPGSYRNRLSSLCCFECLPCPVNAISTKNDSSSCLQCSDHNRSNEDHTACIPKFREYVRWDDGFGITFTCLVSVGFLLTLFCAAVFFKHRTTPMVKATNVEISSLLFVSISCCFLTPIFYIAEPEDWSCQARMITFSISFTLSVAAILVKTLRVLSAFEAKVPVRLNKKSKCLGEHLQIVLVFAVTLIQVCLCVTWLLVEPPEMQVSFSSTSSDTLVVECTTGSLGLMISVYIYLSFLAAIAFILAFRARKLPANFNEAKFITFSMLIFFIVWCSFIPAYATTTGLMTTVVYCIAILASSFGILVCIFFPKIYVILFTPERNTKLAVRASTAQHAIRTVRQKDNTADDFNLTIQDHIPRLFDFTTTTKSFGVNGNSNTNNNNSNYYAVKNKHHGYARSKSFEKGFSEFPDKESITAISTATLQTSIPEDDILFETEAITIEKSQSVDNLQVASSDDSSMTRAKLQEESFA